MFISIKSDFEIPRPTHNLARLIFSLVTAYHEVARPPQLRGARLSFGQFVKLRFNLFRNNLFFRHPNENLLKFDLCLKLEEKQNVKVQSNFRREEG